MQGGGAGLGDWVLKRRLLRFDGEGQDVSMLYFMLVMSACGEG